MWAVTGSIVDQDAVAINDTLAVTMTVPGLALGDLVIAGGINISSIDGGGDGAVIRFEVSAANTLSLLVTADKAEFAIDTITGGVFKVLIGRPAW
jgi:hypothetical protein